MLTPEASRAGRAVLNWGLKDLAERAGVAFTTISQFERGRTCYGSAAAKIVAAFKAEGVEVLNEEGYTWGVIVYKRRRPTVRPSSE